MCKTDLSSDMCESETNNYKPINDPLPGIPACAAMQQLLHAFDKIIDSAIISCDGTLIIYHENV